MGLSIPNCHYIDITVYVVKILQPLNFIVQLAFDFILCEAIILVVDPSLAELSAENAARRPR